MVFEQLYSYNFAVEYLRMYWQLDGRRTLLLQNQSKELHKNAKTLKKKISLEYDKLFLAYQKEYGFFLNNNDIQKRIFIHLSQWEGNDYRRRSKNSYIEIHMSDEINHALYEYGNNLNTAGYQKFQKFIDKTGYELTQIDFLMKLFLKKHNNAMNLMRESSDSHLPFPTIDIIFKPRCYTSIEEFLKFWKTIETTDGFSREEQICREWKKMLYPNVYPSYVYKKLTDFKYTYSWVISLDDLFVNGEVEKNSDINHLNIKKNNE